MTGLLVDTCAPGDVVTIVGSIKSAVSVQQGKRMSKQATMIGQSDSMPPR
jgi:hypothetical protein